MKELYVSPELELLCLTAEERLANSNEIDFDSLLNNNNSGEAVTPSDNDIDVPLDLGGLGL